MHTLSRIPFFYLIATLILSVLPGQSVTPVKAEVDSATNSSVIVKPEGSAFSPVAYNCSAQTEIPVSSCQALVALYNSTGGPGWTYHIGWLVSLTPCSWFGVYCLSGDVSMLTLDSNLLNGSLPPALGSLSKLTRLTLSGNRLIGSIPSELGSLSKLEYLILSSNQLSGPIPPELGSLANLVAMVLSGNRLSGSIPPELGSLSNLVDLQLNGNRLSGRIPPELGSLSKLAFLYLISNQLTGSIPSELGSLSSLSVLDLSFNQLSGSIPATLGGLSNLGNLTLSSNQLSSSIPPELGSLRLASLWLDSNHLSGSIPISFVNNHFMNAFFFSDTNLCEPDTPEFQDWKASVPIWHGTGTCRSISGITTDGVTGISGVTISSGSGVITTTNTSGTYTLTALLAGSYNVTASKSGYSFTPPSQTVNLTDTDKTDIDFTGSGVVSFDQYKVFLALTAKN